MTTHSEFLKTLNLSFKKMQLTSIFPLHSPNSDHVCCDSSFSAALWRGRGGWTNRNFLSLGFVFIFTPWVLPEGHNTYLLMGTLGPAQKIPLWPIAHNWFSYFNLLTIYWVVTLYLGLCGRDPYRILDGSVLCEFLWFSCSVVVTDLLSLGHFLFSWVAFFSFLEVIQYIIVYNPITTTTNKI